MLGKNYLVDILRDEGLTRSTADSVVDTMLDAIYDAIVDKNESFRLNGIGVLKKKTMVPRKFKTPYGEVTKPERLGVKFIPAKSILEELNN